MDEGLRGIVPVTYRKQLVGARAAISNTNQQQRHRTQMDRKVQSSP